MSLCWKPFVSLVTDASGRFKPCCKLSDGSYGMGDLSSASPTKAFFSQPMKELRESFLKGGRPDLCRVCWEAESAGVTSERQAFQSYFSYEVETDNPQVKMIDLKRSNICNAACVMCSPAVSSKKAQLENRLLGTRHNPVIENLKAEDLLQQMQQTLPSLQKLILSSGEPTVDKDLREFLMLVPSEHKNHIDLSLHTNAVHVDSRFLEALKGWRKLHITVSIDGPKEVNECLRVGTPHERVIENYRMLVSSSLCQRQYVGIHATIQALNALRFESLFEMLNDLPVTGDFDLFPLYEPKSLAVEALPPAIKEGLLTRVRQYSLTPLKSELRDSAASLLNDLERMLQSPSDPHLFQELLALVTPYDAVRPQPLFEVFPELDPFSESFHSQASRS